MLVEKIINIVSILWKRQIIWRKKNKKEDTSCETDGVYFFLFFNSILWADNIECEQDSTHFNVTPISWLSKKKNNVVF